jgi:hypothetical protein
MQLLVWCDQQSHFEALPHQHQLWASLWFLKKTRNIVYSSFHNASNLLYSASTNPQRCRCTIYIQAAADSWLRAS